MRMLSSALDRTAGIKGDNQMRKAVNVAVNTQMSKPAKAQVAKNESTKVYTTAQELAWIRQLYKDGKFNTLLGLRQAYKTRTWVDLSMVVDSAKVIDALEAICANIEKIMGLKEGEGTALLASVGTIRGSKSKISVLQSELIATAERARRKGQVQ